MPAMKIAMIGSNGLLADELGFLCQERGFSLSVYGLEAPRRHVYSRFERVNLLTESIDMKDLAAHEMIFYVAGAGIQSNLKENWRAVYGLNTTLPVMLAKGLQDIGFEGTFVTFGSCFEIGANSEDRLFSEQEIASSQLPVPNDYCISKRMLTRFVCSSTLSFKHLHLILPVIYGPDEGSSRLIPYTLAMIERGEKPRFTSGSQVRQYLFAGDAAKAAFALVGAGCSGMFNIPGPERFTVREVVETLYRVKGMELPEGVFGVEERADASMGNLQLDGTKLISALPDLSSQILLSRYYSI